MHLNHPQGQAAEEEALHFLQQQGYTLLARNWHCRFGEIDLILQGQNTLIFAEVRYRRSNRFGGAAASIDRHKLARLQRSIEYYLQIHPTTLDCRLDAILLQQGQPLQWLRNISL